MKFKYNLAVLWSSPINVRLEQNLTVKGQQTLGISREDLVVYGNFNDTTNILRTVWLSTLCL